MKTPIPIPVQAEFVTPPNGLDVNFDADDDLDDETEDDEDFAGSEDEDDEDDKREATAREVASDSAPWSSVPLRPARDFARRDPSAVIDVVFPTVYEEDRTAKLKDLITAQAAGIITHQRMAEQAAKELGFEEYVYADELKEILAEMKKLPPSLLGAADAIAGATKGGGGGAGGGGITIGTPGSGLAAERRGDLSTDSTARFKQQQRSMVSTTDETRESNLALALIQGLREAAIMRAKPDPDALAERAALREALDATRAIAASLTRLLEASARQPAPVLPPPGDVSVTSPVIEVAAPHIEVNVPEQPAPIVNVTIAGGKVTKTVQRDAHGRISGVTEEPSESQ